jgi:hypothetical protein
MELCHCREYIIYPGVIGNVYENPENLYLAGFPFALASSYRYALVSSCTRELKMVNEMYI